MTEEEFLRKLQEHFDVKELELVKEPDKKGSYVMLLHEKIYHLTWKKTSTKYCGCIGCLHLTKLCTKVRYLVFMIHEPINALLLWRGQYAKRYPRTLA